MLALIVGSLGGANRMAEAQNLRQLSHARFWDVNFHRSLLQPVYTAHSTAVTTFRIIGRFLLLFSPGFPDCKAENPIPSVHTTCVQLRRLASVVYSVPIIAVPQPTIVGEANWFVPQTGTTERVKPDPRLVGTIVPTTQHSIGNPNCLTEYNFRSSLYH